MILMSRKILMLSQSGTRAGKYFLLILRNLSPIAKLGISTYIRAGSGLAILMLGRKRLLGISSVLEFVSAKQIGSKSKSNTQDYSNLEPMFVEYMC